MTYLASQSSQGNTIFQVTVQTLTHDLKGTLWQAIVITSLLAVASDAPL